MIHTRLAMVIVAAVSALTWFFVRTRAPGDEPVAAQRADTATHVPRASSPRGLGVRTTASIPVTADEVVLVTGRGPNSSNAAVSLWQRRGRTWQQIDGLIAAHNGIEGWTDAHRAGDDRSPIGVYSLTEAGGVLPNPGTDLPYERNPSYYSRSMYLGNEPADVFDYVIAINFNRRPTAPPSDPVEPRGAAVGGGIWLHVDDGKPTAGCVSISRSDMVEVLRWLKPGDHPVIVMGDKAALAR